MEPSIRSEIAAVFLPVIVWIRDLRSKQSFKICLDSKKSCR